MHEKHERTNERIALDCKLNGSFDRSAMQRWRVRRRPRIGCLGPQARRLRRDPTTAGAWRVDEANTRSQAAGVEWTEENIRKRSLGADVSVWALRPVF
ncbi:hypothetical protein ACQ859_07800 [Roseateles chitinivorans]|uniref:hypothetical protein n=1 Tax=Roseateles chitinivorans TaxID=2917965 RepID=UPI003D6731A7